MRCGMPRPPRLEQNPSCQRDHIGVARADDRFGLIEPVMRPTVTTGRLVARLIARASGT